MCLGCRVFGYHIIPIISWVSTQYFIYRFSIIGYTNSHILLTCIGIVCTLKLHFYENCQSKYLHLTKGHPSTENCCCTYTYCYLDQHCLSVATSTCIIRYIKCHHTHTRTTQIFSWKAKCRMSGMTPWRSVRPLFNHISARVHTQNNIANLAKNN